MPGQQPLVDTEVEFERVWLDDGAWVDIGRGWLARPEPLFDHLKERVPWQASRLFRYDHFVEENRLGAWWRRGTPLPHPVLADVHKTIQRRYDVQFNGFGMMQYRDGRDGQAFHRDTDMKWLDNTVIAILTLGTQRPWLMRPRANRYDHSETRGATHDLRPGNGDLIVMGGSCQAGWEHSVQYLLRTPNVGTRISLQWRYAHRTGRPFQGAGYSAPLNYDRS
jgi:alkylated DNA repair dioxygenase AlkB